MYQPHLFPFRFFRLETDRVVVVSESGDFAFLNDHELSSLIDHPFQLAPERRAELQSKFFLGDPTGIGSRRLLVSRIAQKKETVLSGPSLHAIVPTLKCEHTCTYCQVSRSLSDQGYSLTLSHIDHLCRTIFESPSPTITVEFQGGDPLLRFDLVKYAIEKIDQLNQTYQRNLRFVVSSTLHQLTDAMCDFFSKYHVYLSTSIDGPLKLHNQQRLLRTHDAYERTVKGINLARKLLGRDSVSALMTTTQASLAQPEAIVDEYVKLGLNEIFIRPLSVYGFAKRNLNRLGYTQQAFNTFYERAFARVLYWNRQGYELREVSAALAFNKILSPFDAGFVDMQSPTGAGLACLVYNYDGYVYPSDEARMLAETGDTSLRLGKIGTPLSQLLNGKVMHQLVSASLTDYIPICQSCAFSNYCCPDPVELQGELGSISVPVIWSNHCQRQLALYTFLFKCLDTGNKEIVDLAYDWAIPSSSEMN